MRKIDKLDVIHIKKKADTYIKRTLKLEKDKLCFALLMICSLNQQINYLEHHVIVFMKIAEYLSFRRITKLDAE